MAMNDEETVALIAGGHTFGKTHGAGDPSLIGPDPEGVGGAIEDQGLGWKSKHGTGIGADAITGRTRGDLDAEPRRSGATTSSRTCNFNFEWEFDQESGRREAVEGERRRAQHSGCLRPVEEACSDPLTTDLSLRFDPAYEKISRRFLENPDQFADAFARAWYKLTHRDMGLTVAIAASWCRRKTLIVAGPDPRGRSLGDRRPRMPPR